MVSTAACGVAVGLKVKADFSNDEYSPPDASTWLVWFGSTGTVGPPAPPPNAFDRAGIGMQPPKGQGDTGRTLTRESKAVLIGVCFLIGMWQ